MCQNQRKLLVLGGRPGQVPLIKAAHNEGYYVVLVDYCNTNPGVALADRHYQVAYTEKEKVLEIAKSENVQGVISNAEIAMPIVSYISEKLNLVGNSLDSVLTLNLKNRFRDFQKEHNIFSPKHIITSSFNEALALSGKLDFPILIKPCQSGGSSGTTKVLTPDDLKNHLEDWNTCCDFSSNEKVVLEEFIEPADPNNTIEGDIFIFNGQIIWDGLFTNKRSTYVPLVPMTDIFPLNLAEDKLLEVKAFLQKLLNNANIVFGEHNAELFFDKKGRLFCIEINPRQGGNNIPDIIQKYCGIDMYKLLVTTAMNDDYYFNEVLNCKHTYKYVAKHLVFSHTDGILKELFISPEIAPFVSEIKQIKPLGASIQSCSMASDIIAWVDLQFENRQQQMDFIDQIEHHIFPIVENQK